MALIQIPDTDITYFMENRMKKNLDVKVTKNLLKEDKDYVLVIDGIEGSGKSTLAFQLGRYIDSTLNLSRICFTPEEFKKAVFVAKKGQCIIYDEAFTGLSSRTSLSGINKMLVSLMMQMRQKNLLVIVVLPTFFLLDKYVALFRARSLINVFERKGKRGYYQVFNRKKKKIIFLKGKQTYSYIGAKTQHKGRFYGKFVLGDEQMEIKYRMKKQEALEKVEEDGSSNTESRISLERKIFLANYYVLCKRHHKMTQDKFCEHLRKLNIELDRSSISKIHKEIKDLSLIADKDKI